MTNGTKALLIAADVVIVCILITLAVFSLKDVRQTASTTSEMLNELKGEFAANDLTALEGTELSGATVISAVKKFQDDIPVKVVTLNGGNSTYTGNHILMNTDPSDPNYIKMDASFVCTHEENLNGVITQLNFAEQGVSASVLDVTNIDDAKLMLVNSMTGVSGVSVAQTWKEITDRVKSELSVSSKTQLASALGAEFLDTDTWSTLSNASVNRIHELESQVSIGGSEEHQMQEVVCFSMSECKLDFMPLFAVVTVQGDSTKYFFDDSTWYANGEIMVTARFIINEDENGVVVFHNETSDTVTVKLYK